MHFLKGFTLFFLLCTSVFANPVTVGSFSDGRDHPMLIAFKDNAWTFINNISGVPPSLQPIYMLKVDCKNNDCIAVGGGIGSDSTWPYILRSVDNGSSWHFPFSVRDVPSGAFEFEISLVSCQNGTCVAAGSYHQFATCNYPIFLTSQDKGNQWKVESIANLPNIGSDCVYPTALKCYRDICIAVGKHIKYYNFMTSDPLLFLSQNSGKTWGYLDKSSMHDLPSTLKNANTAGVDCIDKTCVVVGSYGDSTESSYPLILRSTDEGRTWNFLKNLPAFPAAKNITLKHVACINEMCVAGGMAETGNVRQLLLMKSEDKGASWSFVDPIEEWPRSARFKDITALVCLATGCILTGELQDDSPNADPYDTLPFFLVKLASNNTWTFTQRITGLSLPESHPSLYATNCDAEKCYAVGAYDKDSTYLPLILESKDGGFSWNFSKDVINLPSNFKNGVLYDV